MAAMEAQAVILIAVGRLFGQYNIDNLQTNLSFISSFRIFMQIISLDQNLLHILFTHCAVAFIFSQPYIPNRTIQIPAPDHRGRTTIQLHLEYYARFPWIYVVYNQGRIVQVRWVQCKGLSI